MKYLNSTMLSILGFAFILIANNSFGATGPAKDKSNMGYDCADKKDFSFGYIFIEPTEMAYLNSRPIDLLSLARSEFRDQKYSDASRDIYAASQIMKVQSFGNVKGSRLMETANNLEAVSEKVAKNEIRTNAGLDFELSKAAREAAEHHALQATELWFHHLSKNVAADLTAAINATEKSLEWSGEKMSVGGEKVMADSKKLSQKIVAGGKWTADEVGHGIASLGTEINHLGKKMEPNDKTTK